MYDSAKATKVQMPRQNIGKYDLRRHSGPIRCAFIYHKYTDLFDIDDVPEEEHKKTSQKVADTVLADLNEKIDGLKCSCSSTLAARQYPRLRLKIIRLPYNDDLCPFFQFKKLLTKE